MSVAATTRSATLNGRLPAVPTLPIWRLSVAQYHRMIKMAILTEDDPVELLEGWLVQKMPKAPSHAATTEIARGTIDKRLPRGWCTRNQQPITLSDSEPEPDNCVVRGQHQQYIAHHPGPKDVALVMEVSESSLEQDCGPKKRVYAKARIPIYWIINLIDNQVEVYSDPTGPTSRPDYRKREVFGPKNSVPLVLDGKTVGRIPVRELIP
jgi:Uma2 family endonuclease